MRESLLGGCLTDLKRYAEAEHMLLSVYNNVAAGRTSHPEALRDTLGRLITLYELWGKLEQASAWQLKRMDIDFPVDPFGH
jgi:hypothetical protein